MKKVILFESFVKDLNSNKINEGSENPSDYPGKFNAETEKEAGEKWKGFDKWGYPLYVGESAVRLKEFLKDSLTNGKAIIVETKSGKKILVAKHRNGLYYYLADFDESKTIETIKKIAVLKDTPAIETEIISQIDLEDKTEDEMPPEIKEPAIKMIPLTVYIDGKVKKHKARRDAGGHKVKSLTKTGRLGKELKLGYKEDLDNGKTFFNGLEGKSYEYDPTSGQVKELSKEEIRELKLDKYNRPKDKKVMKDWLKKHNIKL